MGHVCEGCIMHRETAEGVVFHLKEHWMNEGFQAEREWCEGQTETEGWEGGSPERVMEGEREWAMRRWTQRQEEKREGGRERKEGWGGRKIDETHSSREINAESEQWGKWRKWGRSWWKERLREHTNNVHLNNVYQVKWAHIQRYHDIFDITSKECRCRFTSTKQKNANHWRKRSKNILDLSEKRVYCTKICTSVTEDR